MRTGPHPAPAPGSDTGPQPARDHSPTPPGDEHRRPYDHDIPAAQRGDEAAFRRLYYDLQPRLLRYLQALAGPDADDLASETWLHITRSLHTFTGDLTAFRAWATTIARNRALDHHRRTRRRPAADTRIEDLTDLPSPDDPESTVLARLATTRAIALIATLPPDQAEAVLLRTVMDLDATHAARILGKQPGAVRVAAHRGLRTLAHRLTRDPDSPHSS